MTLTWTVPAEIPSYSASSVEATVWVRVTSASSAVSSSCSAVTVTVWAVSQSWSVKVSVAGLSDTSVSALPPMAAVTSPAGWVSSTTV